MPMPYSRHQDGDECAIMFAYLFILVLGMAGLVIASVGMPSSINLLKATVGLVSIVLVVVSFVQISKAWVSLRTWLKLFSLIFLIGGLRTAYTSYLDLGFSLPFYVGLGMGVLGILGLIFPRGSGTRG